MDQILNCIREYIEREKCKNQKELFRYFKTIFLNKHKYYNFHSRSLSSYSWNKKHVKREKRFLEDNFTGFKHISGTDEVGRGAIFGPVFSATVLYDKNKFADIVDITDDSKKLSMKKREIIFFYMLDRDINFSLGYSTVDYIECHNILNATIHAVKSGINGLKCPDALHLVDGRFPIERMKNEKENIRMIVRGDSIYPVISLASIIAKVVRDMLVLCYSHFFPGYQLEKNMGYGTTAHFKGIATNGYSYLHRVSFLKKYLQRCKQQTII